MVGYFANKPGVTSFTRLSVHCAERMVATSSSQGVWCERAQVTPGYILSKPCRIFLTRAARSAAVLGSFTRGMMPTYDSTARNCDDGNMRRVTLLILAAGLMQAQEIRKAAEPRKFIEAVGWRAALLGHEDGTFEAWMMPVKVLRDFKLSVYFDGSLEPVPIADLAERVSVSPGHVTITHAHAAFTIRQTWVPSLGLPAAAVLLDIDTQRPIRLRASFTVEMRPMWPASFSGQSSSFDPAEKALVLEEGLHPHAAG